MIQFETLKRFVRFGVVGLSGVVVDMTVLFLLADPRTLAWPVFLSKTVAAEVAIFNNFIWNDLWTFGELRDRRGGARSSFSRFWKFNAICLAGIGLSLLLLNAQIRLLHFDMYLANLVAIFIVSIWNYWMSATFGWKKAPHNIDR